MALKELESDHFKRKMLNTEAHLNIQACVSGKTYKSQVSGIAIF